MKIKLHTKPWSHQLKALKYLLPRNFGALYTDMGSGKTKVLIDLVRNRGFKRTVIVAPNKVCTLQVWEKEIDKHSKSGEFYCKNMAGLSSNIKVQLLKLKSKSPQEVVIINYEAIWRKPFRDYLIKYKPDCIICDESHKIKGAGSKCSKFLHLIGKRTPNRYMLTGTPLAQSPLDIYAQYRYLNPEIFGTNFNHFKDRYANYRIVSGGYPILDKKEPYKNLDELHDKMFSCAFVCTPDLKLVETNETIIYFTLNDKAKLYSKELKTEGCIEIGEKVVEAPNILTEILRLQQIASGYVPATDENGVTKFVRLGDYRIDALREVLEKIPEHEPIVVFAKFTKDIKNIRKLVKDMGRTSSELSGKKDTFDNWTEDKSKILVVQIASGAEGIDLTRARYCIYYTLTHSLSQYLQSRKRVHRPSQTRPVEYYILLGKNTIDTKIYKALKENKNLIDMIINGEV